MGETFDDREIVRRRLGTQRLVGSPFGSPAEALDDLLAVQSQEYLMARWALGMRSACDESAIETAFAAGEILRTHVLRPTWHFVTPADIRWLLALTAPRVHAFNAPYYRKLELDHNLFQRIVTVLTHALQGGNQLTRDQVRSVLAQAGIATTGELRLSYILMRAELDGVI